MRRLLPITMLLLSVSLPLMVIARSPRGDCASAARTHAEQTPVAPAPARQAAKSRPDPRLAVTVAADTQEGLRLPDDTAVPGLNGVRKPAPLRWPAEVPFSPVVGTRTDPR